MSHMHIWTKKQCRLLESILYIFIYDEMQERLKVAMCLVFQQIIDGSTCFPTKQRAHIFAWSLLSEQSKAKLQRWNHSTQWDTPLNTSWPRDSL